MYILFAVRFVDISLVPIIIVSKSIIVSNEYEMYTQQRMYYAWTYFFLEFARITMICFIKSPFCKKWIETVRF